MKIERQTSNVKRETSNVKREISNIQYPISLLLVACFLLLTACGPAQPKGEVIVYVAAPLSGFQANGGQTVLGGARLMAERLNQAGGLLGYRVRVVGIDDESDSDVAVEVAQQIKEALERGDRIIGLIGHYNSGQTLAAMEVYQGLPLVVITPTASEVSLTQRGYGNFFRVNANDATQARVDAEFLVNTLGARRVAVVYNDDPYGQGLGALIAENLRSLGAQVPLEIQVAVEQSSFTEEVKRITAANPDAIFYGGYEVEAPYLRAELVEAGIIVPFLASDGAFLSATIDEAGGTAEGIYVSAFAPSPAAVVDKQWIKEYQEVDYRNPDTYSINGYSAMHVLAEGIKKAQSFDAAKVAQAIRQLDFDTLVGHISYDRGGDLKEQSIYIFQVQDGAFVQIHPEL
ncbi:MAG: branched-chain amino acid ABC transporter substrate-binding protein [Chloroflexi bacterium]|nr:branched-chain amino acid ABC transporter substrate-binding protein [Chloroflexota bacterium]